MILLRLQDSQFTLYLIPSKDKGRVWQDDVIGPNQLGQVRQFDVIGPNQLGRVL